MHIFRPRKTSVHSLIKMLNYNSPPLLCCGQITLSNNHKICPLAIPNQITLISMHVSSLVKIPWHLLKLSFGKENLGMSRADNSVKMPISNPKPDPHNINSENPFMFTQVIIQKWKTGRQHMNVCMTDGWTHGCPTLNRNTRRWLAPTRYLFRY